MRASVVTGAVTVRVTVVEPAPEAMDAEEKLAVAPVGRPATVKVMGAGKVVAGDTGLTVKVKVAAVPGSIVADDAPLELTEKSSTSSISAVAAEAWLLVSPGYVAVIDCEPVARVVVVSLAMAEAPEPEVLNDPVPIEVPPS